MLYLRSEHPGSRLSPCSLKFGLGAFGVGSRDLHLRSFGSRFLFSRLNTLRAQERATILVTAPPPFQQSIDPRWGLADCSRALSLRCAELARIGEMFSGVTKLILAGLDCEPRSVV
jgi:hypothetical protein